MSHTIFVVLVLFDARIIEERMKEVMSHCRRCAGPSGDAGHGENASRLWMRRKEKEKIALFVAAENVYLICQTF